LCINRCLLLIYSPLDKFGLHTYAEFTLWSGFLRTWLSSAKLVCGSSTYSLADFNQRGDTFGEYGNTNLVTRLPSSPANLLWPYPTYLTEISWLPFTRPTSQVPYYSVVSDNLFNFAVYVSFSYSFIILLMVFFSLPENKETVIYQQNKTAMLFYLTVENSHKSKATFYTLSDLENCLFVPSLNMVDKYGMV
jgi:hypothetical protein